MPKLLRISWIVFIAIIILSKFYLRIMGIRPLGGVPAVLLLFFLIFFVVHRTQTVWYFAYGVFLYGLYELLFISVYAAEPTRMQFTYPLIYLLYGGSNRAYFMGVLNDVPLVFYTGALILLPVRAVRRGYGVST